MKFLDQTTLRHLRLKHKEITQSVLYRRLLQIENKSAQSNLGRGPRRCESLPRGGLIRMAKVVTGEFITPHQMASGSDPPLDRPTHRQTDRRTDRQIVHGKV